MKHSLSQTFTACTSWLVMLLLVGISASCATGTMLPDEVTFGTSVLEEKLAKKFPLDKRMLELLDVTTGKPKLRMLPDTNRIGLDLDASFHGAGASLLGGSDSIGGKLSLNSGLRYDSDSRAIVLVEPKVEKISMDKVAGQSDFLTGKVKIMLGMLVEQALDGAAVHTFTEEELTKFGSRIEPGDITVRPYGIKVGIKQRDAVPASTK